MIEKRDSYAFGITFFTCFVVLSGLLMISCGNSQSEKPGAGAPDSYGVMELAQGWEIQSSAKCTEKGAVIAATGMNTGGWYKTNLPATVLAALVKNGVYKDIYFSKNLEKIPAEPFKHSWWYRKEFSLHKKTPARLIFEGINYRANVWLNGKQIAVAEKMVGPYGMFDFDVSAAAVIGKNVLAVEIFPPKKGDLTIGWVDWNPLPPDNNMGLWRAVKIKQSGHVSMDHIYVRSKVNTDTLKEAALTITAGLKNYAGKEISGEVKGRIENISFTKAYTLKAGESRTIAIEPAEYKQLSIKNPRLWWPNNLGEPNLYRLEMSVSVKEGTGVTVSDGGSVRFGIREVADYMNEEGHRGYKVNGKKVLIRGAAWVDDMLLADEAEKVDAQMRYVKHMNLNTIRLEGFWGNSRAIFDRADEYGIMIMIGLSCQWEWEEYCGRPAIKYMSVTSEEDIQRQAEGYGDQVTWLRNHPSIFVWVYGSDKLPSPEFEKRLNTYVKAADDTRPILGACKYKVFLDKHDLKVKDEFEFQTSEISGPTGVKMLGAWEYEPPVYWFIDKEYGGAYGFNTETGPGPQPPPLESLKKMIPEEHLWPINDYWDYHCGRNEFNTLKRYVNAFDKRYGKAAGVEEFAFNAQIANYEAMRPMFEAFGVNKHNATGVIGWMLNSAWPEMYWQLFDYYLMPSGAFYATRKACQPLNLVYNYGDKQVYLVNETHEAREGLTAEIKVLDLDSKVLLEKEPAVKVGENTGTKIFDLSGLENLTDVYFVSLKLKDATGKMVADNFYWLSKKEDTLDKKKTIWLYTPQKDYADFTALKKMAPVEIKTNVHFGEEAKGKTRSVKVELTNPTDKLAFFIELKVVGDKDGETILPVFWSDNYVSLPPGETRSFRATFADKDLKGQKPVFKFSGFNVK